MKHGRVQNLKTLSTQGTFLALGVLVFSLISAPVAAEVYKWTDENGVTHYTQTPPPAGQEVEVEDLPEFEAPADSGTPTALEAGSSDSEELSAADLKRQELAASRKARAEERSETEAICLDAQQRLAQLEPSRRVFYTNEDGETARMDDEERVAEVQRLKDIQTERCQ